MRWKLILTMLLMCLTLGLSASYKDASAAEKYKIRINKRQNTVTVYQQEKGTYKACKAFVCSVGESTPIGSFRITNKYRWRALVDSTYGQYSTRFVGPYLFHSVWYYKTNAKTLSYEEFNKLGTTASHGCIRLYVRDAKWIYDNCPIGTPVEVYSAKKPGPLGKPEAIRLRGKTGYDPTDIWSKGNPFNKKKPKITGAKNKTITYGDAEYDPMTGIKAKNTTGFNAVKRVSLQIKYRKNTAEDYRSVKRVDTKKPGLYRITYKLTDEIGRKAKVTVTHRVKEAEAVQTPEPLVTPEPETAAR